MRKIIHIDMDAFFASVEMRDNPSLRNVPMAVGGPRDSRGVISTANYEARKFGVRSAMPSALAQKICPHLIIVRGRMDKYKEASKIVFNIFHEYTHLVQGLSLDEAFLDVTDSSFFHNSATLMAQDIRRKIFERTGGLTASAGIAPNKLVAKLATDVNKPHGQFTVIPEEVDSFIKKVPIEKIWGVGKVTAKRMEELEIKTCEDLRDYSQSELIHLFGKFGEGLFHFCRGIDNREVEVDRERKSLGSEETFSEDIHHYEEMKGRLKEIFQDLSSSMKKYKNRKIKALQVKIKYFDFKLTTIERSLPFNEESFLTLFQERWTESPRPVRLLGLGVKFEEAKKLDQLSLLA